MLSPASVTKFGIQSKLSATLGAKLFIHLNQRGGECLRLLAGWVGWMMADCKQFGNFRNLNRGYPIIHTLCPGFALGVEFACIYQGLDLREREESFVFLSRRSRKLSSASFPFVPSLTTCPAGPPLNTPTVDSTTLESSLQSARRFFEYDRFPSACCSRYPW